MNKNITLKIDKDLFKHILYSKQITIVTHPSPDGDAMGSSLALYEYFKRIGYSISNPNINVITPNSCPDFLKFLPNYDKVLEFDKNKEVCIDILKNTDLLFILDFNTLKRIGELGEYISKTSSFRVMIDHHREPDDICDVTISDTTASSTCQMLYRFLKELDNVFTDGINKEVAECLYTGIVTDSGSFKFPRTTSELHTIVSDLILYGADNIKIQSLIYDNNSIDRLKLTSYAIANKMIVIEELKVSIITLTEEEKVKLNYKKGDTEGLVNLPMSCHNIHTSIYLTVEEGITKVSFRSKGDIDVSKIAKENFIGGGHFNAAGATSKDNFDDTLSKLKKILFNYKEMLLCNK